MDKAQVKAIFLAAGFKEKVQEDGNLDLNPYVYEAVKAYTDTLIEEVARKIESEDTRLVKEQDYMLSATDCGQMMRWFKSGNKSLFECNHETKLMNSKTHRCSCADCGASLNGPD